LVEAVQEDALDADSEHDMGGNIVTNLVSSGDAHVYDYSTNQVPGTTQRDMGYWRDVGTIDSYYDAQMDLISVHPIFNLYNEEWPIHTYHPTHLPPAKFVFDEAGRRGVAIDSMVCSGSILSGGAVRGSVVSPGVVVHTGAQVEGSVLFGGIDVGRGAVIRRAIIDKNVKIPPGCTIGVDHDLDRRRGFTISEGGVVVVGKGDTISPD